jgi:hypothetical protein
VLTNRPRAHRRSAEHHLVTEALPPIILRDNLFPSPETPPQRKAVANAVERRWRAALAGVCIGVLVSMGSMG